MPRRAAAPSQGVVRWSGSRFWALAEAESDDEEEIDVQEWPRIFPNIIEDGRGPDRKIGGMRQAQ